MSGKPASASNDKVDKASAEQPYDWCPGPCKGFCGMCEGFWQHHRKQLGPREHDGIGWLWGDWFSLGFGLCTLLVFIMMLFATFLRDWYRSKTVGVLHGLSGALFSREYGFGLVQYCLDFSVLESKGTLLEYLPSASCGLYDFNLCPWKEWQTKFAAARACGILSFICLAVAAILVFTTIPVRFNFKRLFLWRMTTLMLFLALIFAVVMLSMGISVFTTKSSCPLLRTLQERHHSSPPPTAPPSFPPDAVVDVTPIPFFPVPIFSNLSIPPASLDVYDTLPSLGPTPLFPAFVASIPSLYVTSGSPSADYTSPSVVPTIPALLPPAVLPASPLIRETYATVLIMGFDSNSSVHVPPAFTPVGPITGALASPYYKDLPSALPNLPQAYLDASQLNLAVGVGNMPATLPAIEASMEPPFVPPSDLIWGTISASGCDNFVMAILSSYLLVYNPTMISPTGGPISTTTTCAVGAAVTVLGTATAFILILFVLALVFGVLRYAKTYERPVVRPCEDTETMSYLLNLYLPTMEDREYCAMVYDDAI